MPKHPKRQGARRGCVGSGGSETSTGARGRARGPRTSFRRVQAKLRAAEKAGDTGKAEKLRRMLENAARGARCAKRHDHQVRNQQASAAQASAPQAGAAQAGAQQASAPSSDACGYAKRDKYDSKEDVKVWLLFHIRTPAKWSPCLTCGSAAYNLDCGCCLAQMPSQPEGCEHCRKWRE